MTVAGTGQSAPQAWLCGLCGLLCKRASRIACCNAQCCWGCGVRFVTKSRKCWNCPNVVATTKDLLQHAELREAIRVHSLQRPKELITQVNSKHEVEETLQELIRLKENNNKDEGEEHVEDSPISSSGSSNANRSPSNFSSHREKSPSHSASVEEEINADASISSHEENDIIKLDNLALKTENNSKSIISEDTSKKLSISEQSKNLGCDKECISETCERIPRIEGCDNKLENCDNTLVLNNSAISRSLNTPNDNRTGNNGEKDPVKSDVNSEHPVETNDSNEQLEVAPFTPRRSSRRRIGRTSLWNSTTPTSSSPKKCQSVEKQKNGKQDKFSDVSKEPVVVETPANISPTLKIKENFEKLEEGVCSNEQTKLESGSECMNTTSSKPSTAVNLSNGIEVICPLVDKRAPIDEQDTKTSKAVEEASVPLSNDNELEDISGFAGKESTVGVKVNSVQKSKALEIKDKKISTKVSIDKTTMGKMSKPVNLSTTSGSNLQVVVLQDHEEFREEEVTKRLVREIKMDNVNKKTFDSSNKLKCPLREDNIIKIIDVEEEEEKRKEKERRKAEKRKREEEERAERRRLSGRSRISLYEPPGRSSSLHKVLGKMRSDQDDGWKTVRRTASPEERVWLHDKSKMRSHQDFLSKSRTETRCSPRVCEEIDLTDEANDVDVKSEVTPRRFEMKSEDVKSGISIRNIEVRGRNSDLKPTLMSRKGEIKAYDNYEDNCSQELERKIEGRPLVIKSERDEIFRNVSRSEDRSHLSLGRIEKLRNSEERDHSLSITIKSEVKVKTEEPVIKLSDDSLLSANTLQMGLKLNVKNESFNEDFVDDDAKFKIKERNGSIMRAMSDEDDDNKLNENGMKMDKVQFKLMDSKNRLMRSLTPEQEQYLHQLKIEEMEEKLCNSEKGKTERNVSILKIEDPLGHSKSSEDIKEENDSPNTKVLNDENDEKERRERLEAVADAKLNLEQIKAELKRVKNRVKGSKKKKGKKLKKKDKDTEEMIRLERELERMAKEVKDIEGDSSYDEGDSERKKHKKKKKSKSKEKFIPDDKINIEVDAKLGQKILSMFVSGDMLQDVLKKEAKNTETAIQSIKKALEKKQYKDEKRKKKKKKGKDRKETDNDDQKEDVEKKLKSLDAAHAKYESKMAELLHSSSSRSPSRSTECSSKRKSRNTSPERESSRCKRRKHSRSPESSSKYTITTSNTGEDFRTIKIVEESSKATIEEDESSDASIKKKKKKKDKRDERRRGGDERDDRRRGVDERDEWRREDRDDRRRGREERDERRSYKNKKSRREDGERVVNTDIDSVSKERERSQEAEDLDILDINIGENDLIKESRGMGLNEKYISRDKNVQENPESENKVTTTTEDPPDEKVDPVKELEQRKAVEAKLQAAMLAQRNARFAQPIVQPKPKLQKNQEDNGSQFVTSTTPTVHYPNLPLPRYSYSYSRTFITAEQKVEHFPNLYKRFFIPIDSDGDDSSDEDCPKDCGSKKKGVVTDQSLVKFLRNLRSDSPR